MTAGPLKVWDCADLPIHEARAWRDEIGARLTAGARPVTLFGRPDDGDVLATCILQDDDGVLSALRGRLERGGRGYHALTAAFPAMHCFERELHEQHGVRVAGHPWLKPIRFEAGDRAQRDEYPFYRVEGKEVHEVAVGPSHAGVIEPGSFRFMCLGEQVHHLEIHLGYQHRGVEKLLLRGDPRRLTPLVETIAGDSSVAHAWAYCAAIEALTAFDASALEIPRGVMLELERVAMHLATLSGLAADVGFLQGASTYGRLRTTAINTSMRLCGSRFGRTALRPAGSGVRLDGHAGTGEGAKGTLSLAELRKNLQLLRTDLAIIDDCFLEARTVRHRLQGVGALTAAQARELGLVGLAARACGVAIDQRTHSGGVFAKPRLSMTTEDTGDCWARARIRTRELQASLDWIEAALEVRAHFRPSRESVGALRPGQLVVNVVEGWRGEVVHCLETDARGDLAHYKVQDPSLRNWMGLAVAVRENEISDFPICNKSFDLSYCGNDL